MIFKTSTAPDGVFRTSVMMNREDFDRFEGRVAKTYPTANRDLYFVDIMGLGTNEVTSRDAARVEIQVEIWRLENLKDPKVSQVNRLAFLRSIL